MSLSSGNDTQNEGIVKKVEGLEIVWKEKQEEKEKKLRKGKKLYNRKVGFMYYFFRNYLECKSVFCTNFYKFQ